MYEMGSSYTRCNSNPPLAAAFADSPLVAELAADPPAAVGNADVKQLFTDQSFITAAETETSCAPARLC